MSDHAAPAGAEPARDTLPGSGLIWRVAALVTLGTGGFLLATGRGPISAGVLLAIAGIAAAGVLLGAGQRSEGVNDLSARLGLGLLGGMLGGVGIMGVRAVLEGLGVPGWLGVELTPLWTTAAFMSHLGAATIWGLVLGIIYPHFPGVSPGSKGLRFSIVISLYMFVRGYPVDLDLGWFGLDLGVFAWVFVLTLNAVWGVIAGHTIGWGDVAEEAPVARPIDS